MDLNKATEKIELEKTKVIGNSIVSYKRNDNEICLLDELEINGIKINMFELGETRDVNPGVAPPTGCGSRRYFGSREFSNGLLNKLNIDSDELIKILEYLEEELYIGFCRYCR